MEKPCIAKLTSRKSPKQERSKQLVFNILSAARRVLNREGAHRFTTARVAEETGISVGSLYQYFPNKESILFRLQADEWSQNCQRLNEIVLNKAMPSLERLRRLIHEFVLSECDEAPMRQALADAAPLYRNAPEAQELAESGSRLMGNFMQELLPHLDYQKRLVVADVVLLVMTAVGERISETEAIDGSALAKSDALAEMICAYIEKLR